MNRAMLLAVALLLVTAPATQAQTIDGGAYFTPITDNVQPLIYGNLFSKSYLERKAKDRHRTARDAPVRASVPSSPASDELALRFDPSVSRAVRDDYIASIGRANGAQAARSLGNYYAAHDVRELLRKAVAPYGLRTDDLADVTAAWFVVMWMTANQAPLPAPADVQGVQRQMRDTLLAGGTVPAGARERQRSGEALMYQTVTLIRVREEAQASGNDAFLAQLADSAQASMARQDFDLRGLVLSEAGVVPR